MSFRPRWIIILRISAADGGSFSDMLKRLPRILRGSRCFLCVVVGTRRPGVSVIQRPQGAAVDMRRLRRTATTVDAGGSRSPPSSSRSGDPPRREEHQTVDAEAHHFRHSEGYAVPRGIPNGGAERYVIVSLVEPTGGLRRRKVRSTPLPPCGESFSHSLAPPFRTRSASLGSRPRRGQRSARMTAIFKLRSLRMTYETAKNNTVKKSKGV